MKPINEPVEETTDNRPMISMSNFSVAKNNEPAENLTSPVTLQVKETTGNIETTFKSDSHIENSIKKSNTF